MAGVRLDEVSARQIYMFQSDCARACVARWKIALVRCCRKTNGCTQLATERDHVDAIAHLWDPMMGCIDKRIRCVVAHAIKGFYYLLRHVVASKVHNVGYVFQEKCKGLKTTHVVEIPKIKIRSWIDLIGPR